jgi:tRNA dimethylallyltransferase
MISNPILIISGPTATGKSALAIKIALKARELFNRDAEIINFDSLLFYKELNIGTAKPSAQELELIPHHMINIASIKEPLNAADFSEKAFVLVQNLQKRNKIPILVGGSGFYLRALIKGMIQAPHKDPLKEAQARSLYEQKGIEPILEYLKVNDPDSLLSLHINDHYRLMRAYEYHLQTGLPLSKQKDLIEEKKPYDFSLHQFAGSTLYHVYLNVPPQEHWAIIEKRTKEMHQNGLLDEVRSLVNHGFSKQHKPLESIGYKESLQYLQGLYKDDASYLEAINISTRQLAKSQRTFFQKIIPKIEYHPLKDHDRLWIDLCQWWTSGETSGS